MEIEAMIRQIPCLEGKHVVHEPLNGGLSNQTYRLSCDGRRHVLRVFGRQAEYLQLSRESEAEVLRQLHRPGGSPAVLYADPDNRFMLLEYIDGRQVTSEDLQDAGMRRQILDRLRRIHDSEAAQPLASRECSPYQLIDRYLRGSDRLQVRRPDGLAPLLANMEQIARRRSSDKVYSRKFCHNDYYVFNLIWSPEQESLHVVDWELSGFGDVFFDLAAIPFTNRFTAEQEREWLQSYFGYYEEEQYQSLQDMKYLNMLRECAWGLLHSGLAQESVNHSFEYYKHAERAIERLQQGFNYF